MKIDDIILSRYACYLIVMNGDPQKSIKQIEREAEKKHLVDDTIIDDA